MNTFKDLYNQLSVVLNAHRMSVISLNAGTDEAPDFVTLVMEDSADDYGVNLQKVSFFCGNYSVHFRFLKESEQFKIWTDNKEPDMGHLHYMALSIKERPFPNLNNAHRKLLDKTISRLIKGSDGYKFHDKGTVNIISPNSDGKQWLSTCFICCTHTDIIDFPGGISILNNLEHCRNIEQRPMESHLYICITCLKKIVEYDDISKLLK